MSTLQSRAERTTTPDGFAETGIITYQGQEYASGGAAVSDAYLICYPGPRERSWDARSCMVWTGPVSTWSGERIGRYRETGHAPAWGGHGLRTMLTCYRVWLDDGREYVGRGLGPNMFLRCRRATTTKGTTR